MFEHPFRKKAAMYLRVSTNDQDNRNQETGVRHYAETHGYEIEGIFTETVSSKIAWQQRELGSALATLPPGSTLICAEVSRLARNTLEVLQIAAEAAEREIIIIATKNNLTFNNTIESRITTTILGLAAEIEREFIRSRTTEALARAKASGVKLGRPVGSRGGNKLDGRESELLRYLEKKVAKISIAKLMDVSRGTVNAKIRQLQATRADQLTQELPL